MIEKVIEFEDNIKQYQCLYFNKVWEKHKNIWKLIYNIQGLVVDNKFYCNLKIIFWYNETKTELSENVITFLYSQNCIYKTINLTDINQNINSILNMFYKQETNQLLNQLVVGGTDRFNEILSEREIDDFIQTIKFIPHEDTACSMTIFKFEIQTNKKLYTILLQFKDNDIKLMYRGTEQMTGLDTIYKNIIDLIYT